MLDTLDVASNHLRLRRQEDDAKALWRSRLLAAGTGGKAHMGTTLTLIVTGLDKRLETALVDASPALLTEIITRFLSATGFSAGGPRANSSLAGAQLQQNG